VEDFLRNPTASLKDTARYIVDPFATAGSFWLPLDLPFDVEEGTYQSCIGRPSGGFIDGIYTSGTVRGKAQFAYLPLFNLAGNAAPMPTRLLLPNFSNPVGFFSLMMKYHKHNLVYH